MPLETSTTNLIIERLKRDFWPCYVVKNHGSARGRRGRPDIEFTKDGRIVYFEVKQRGKKASRQQEVEMQRIRQNGKAEAVVVYCYEDVWDHLRDLSWIPS